MEKIILFVISLRLTSGDDVFFSTIINSINETVALPSKVTISNRPLVYSFTSLSSIYVKAVRNNEMVIAKSHAPIISTLLKNVFLILDTCAK